MTAAARRDVSIEPAPRAKSLRPGDASPELTNALEAFSRASAEHARRHDAATEAARKRAAFGVVVALSREARRPVCSLSPALVAAVERWEDGEFAGTDVDIDVAEQAAWELLASDV